MADGGNDVAHTLADALQKIENILSDDRNQNHFLYEDNFQGDNDPGYLSQKIHNCAHELRASIEAVDASLENQIILPSDTIQVLLKWLQSLREKPASSRNSTLEKSKHLNDNECSETELLSYREKVLRLENEKDSLLLQVSVLTDQVEVQGEKIRDLEFTKDEQHIKLAELEEKLNQAKKEVYSFEKKNNFLRIEVSDMKLLVEQERTDTAITESCKKEKELKEEIGRRDLEIEDLRTHLETLLDEEEREKRLSTCSDSGNSFGIKIQLREKASEVSRLKIKLEKLTTILNEKETLIEDLKKKVTVSPTQLQNDDEKSERSINIPAADDVFDAQETLETLPISNKVNSSNPVIENEQETPKEKSPVDNIDIHSTVSYNSSELNNSNPTSIHGGEQPSLKRDKGRSSFGKGFLKIRRNNSTSEPNLSPPEGNSADESDEKTSYHHVDHHEKGKKRNIVGKVFGKLRRSNSQGFESELKPHSSSGQVKKLHSDVPFSSWTAEMVSNWLEDEGLGQYADACLNCIKTGDDVVKMSSSDLEKLFGMKKVLHRKKLHLALQAMTDESDVMGHLDNNWVLDWLDDIGLPQYKDLFHDNIVDGRMLNYLTVNDVLQLKVYSTFHQHSLRRAIQCLRIHNFHPNYLKKSPIDESWQKGADVVLWTNHRVTEWLRQADLSEYATNLRGSGVHGSLMILEPRFTAESMATLLSIPVGKKLLRRHLATHFESLVGAACMKVKEAALTSGLSPILPGEKHKALKRSLSIGGMKKRTKSETECEEYVCPMDTEVPIPLQKIFLPRLRKNDDVSSGHVSAQKPPGRGRQGQDELTKTLGTFSKELNSLTDMLGQDDSGGK